MKSISAIIRIAEEDIIGLTKTGDLIYISLDINRCLSVCQGAWAMLKGKMVKIHYIPANAVIGDKSCRMPLNSVFI